MAHDVFISYSTKDKAIADAVCNNLEKNGVRCWIAPRDVLPGMNWGESIIDAINEANLLVLVFSSNSNKSSNVMRELERAVSTDTIIIPFRVEDVDPSKKLSYFIAGAHWLDALTPPLEAHIGSLTKTVSKLLSNDISEIDTQDLEETHKTSLYNKIRKPELSPSITIITGIIVFTIFNLIYNASFGGSIVVIIGMIIGGFIATYFANEKKVQYGLYVAIGITITTLFKDFNKIDVTTIVTLLIFSVVFASIGSFLGKKISEYIMKGK